MKSLSVVDPHNTVVERLLDALRSGGVTCPNVLDAMARVPRDQFVDEAMMDYAWDNLALPIGDDQTISQPLMVGLMTQALNVTPSDKVLEIGTGSGYQCAVLSKLARRVYSIERYKNLHDGSINRFEALRLRNIVCRLDNGWRGWPEQAPFTRIMVTAAAPELPQVLWDQLAEGGHMVVPIGEQGQSQTVVKVSRVDGQLMQELVTPAKFVPMVDDAPVKNT